jgi:hypothetical protein
MGYARSVNHFSDIPSDKPDTHRILQRPMNNRMHLAHGSRRKALIQFLGMQGLHLLGHELGKHDLAERRDNVQTNELPVAPPRSRLDGVFRRLYPCEQKLLDSLAVTSCGEPLLLIAQRSVA